MEMGPLLRGPRTDFGILIGCQIFLSLVMSFVRRILGDSLDASGLGRGKLRPSFFTWSRGTRSVEDELTEESSLGTGLLGPNPFP